MRPSLRTRALSTCAALATLVALVCTSCSLFSPAATPIRYVVLVPIHASSEVEPARASLAPGERVGLGPLSLPDYLLRASLVTREQETRLVASDTERWAEPLDRAVERVLALDLQHALGVQRLVPYPWYATDRPDVQIEIAFSRFERDESGKVIVQASWSVTRGDGSRARIDRESAFEHEATADGAATAMALSRALADLCDEIARACTPEPSSQG